MTHKNHLDDEIVFIVTLQPVVLWMNKIMMRLQL